VLTSFDSHLTAATKCSRWIKLPCRACKRSTAKKLKNGSVQTQGESSPSIEVANYSEMHKSELQKAKYLLMSSGRQACVLVTRTSSDHSISLCPQTTQLAHVNHPALLKTSDQPSLIFRRSLLLRLSKRQMSALCQA
jgi:hypothetical protein